MYLRLARLEWRSWFEPTGAGPARWRWWRGGRIRGWWRGNWWRWPGWRVAQLTDERGRLETTACNSDESENKKLVCLRWSLNKACCLVFFISLIKTINSKFWDRDLPRCVSVSALHTLHTNNVSPLVFVFWSGQPLIITMLTTTVAYAPYNSTVGNWGSYKTSQ